MVTTKELVNERAARKQALKAAVSNRVNRARNRHAARHGSSQFVADILPKNKMVLSKKDFKQMQRAIATLSHELNKLKALANNVVVVDSLGGDAA